MAHDSVTNLVSEYQQKRSDYTRAARLASDRLKRIVRREGFVGCEVTHRAKTPLSLAKKLIRKPRYASLAEIPDLAGARLTVVGLADRDRADVMIQRVFPGSIREDKAPAEPDSFGYLGIHYDAPIGDRHMSPVDDKLTTRRCEIQLHTRVQTAWAMITHDSVYKPDITPTDAERRHFARLVALLEIFDLEAERGLQSMRSTPEFATSKLVEALQSMFVTLTAGIGDPLLSMQLVPQLVEALYEDGDPVEIAKHVNELTKRDWAYVRSVLGKYSNDHRHPLLSQPEVLLLWERLENDLYLTIERWPSGLDGELLTGTAQALGYALPDIA